MSKLTERRHSGGRDSLSVAVNATADGDNTIVAAPGGTKIRVRILGLADSQAPIAEQAVQRTMRAIDRAEAPERQGSPAVRPGTAPAGR